MEDFEPETLIFNNREREREVILKGKSCSKCCLPCFMVKDGSWSCRPLITLAGIPAAMLQIKQVKQ